MKPPRPRLAVRAIVLVALVSVLSPATVAATPTATNDVQYGMLGRVFPDPLAGCQNLGASPCSPNAQGNIAASQFIQWGEFLDSLEFMNQREDWSPYMEVLPLDGRFGPGARTGDDVSSRQVFPGNTLEQLEFEPREEYQSAGLPTGTLGRQKSDLITVRVTDERVPDAGKQRYALSLSIHGIERAGIEGATRAIEDLVTARTTGRDDEPVVPREVDPDAPTFAEVLRESIIYFTYPNPDGWRRGSVSEGGLFFQRYNGNGVDLNRDWPDIGFSFRPYSGLSEPESRAFAGFFDDVKSTTGDDFAAGDDLHGQPFADALSYTLLPHGLHDFGKDARIRNTAIAIHKASEKALEWSPIIQPNDAPQGGGVPCAPGALGDTCAQIYGQTWGTVYDTINYTTTGALGDYFDSSVGLNADGIDNEMSFSHLDKNITFDPHTEQLHVDGNKILIYAHLSQLLNRKTTRLDTPGANGYVPNARVTRAEKEFDPGPPPGTSPQDPIVGQTGTPTTDLQTVFPFTVERDDDTYSGGMRVDITKGNVQGIGDGGLTTLKVQCRGCDEHPGVEDGDEWVTVAEDFNQSPIYLQSGLTAAVNRPEALKADGTPVEWRALLDGPQAATMNVEFTSGRATTDGATGGDDPDRLAAYDVANTDFFSRLDPFFNDAGDRFAAVDPRAVIDGDQSLAGLRSLVLADDALPGYTGPYDGEAGAGTEPSEAPSDDFTFTSSRTTVPGAGSRAPNTFEDHDFTIAPEDGNASMTIAVTWPTNTDDYDLYLFRRESNGDLTEVASSAGGIPQTSEQLTVNEPPAGDYVIRVDNWAAANNQTEGWDGTATFEGIDAGEPPPSGTGDYTVAEKDDWFEALRAYVEGGGNLVLTDGAMRGLSELTAIPASAVARQTVYAGQVSFAEVESDDTTRDDPLARRVRQPGARFNGGEEQMRRQTFEPTPLGFSIQSDSGGDQSNARQFHVAKQAFTDAGGRVVATSADAGDRDAAADFDNVTVGELGLGEGTIRVAGALLPQPTTEFDHPLGVEPFAVTYTGYILFCNLIDCEVTETATDGGGPGGDSGTPGGDSPAPGETGGTPGDGTQKGGSGGGSGGTSADSCFRAATAARGNRVGRAGLARSRATVRGTFGSSGRYRRFVDRYCLRDGGTVRIAYATPRERNRLSRSERRRIGRESIFVLTTSRALRIRGVRRGMGVRAMHRRIGGGNRVRVGKNLWYFRKGRNSRHIFKVQRGRVLEMGIADARLTQGRGRARGFFRQNR